MQYIAMMDIVLGGTMGQDWEKDNLDISLLK
jgi:hypothetical protein